MMGRGILVYIRVWLTDELEYVTRSGDDEDETNCRSTLIRQAKIKTAPWLTIDEALACLFASAMRRTGRHLPTEGHTE